MSTLSVTRKKPDEPGIVAKTLFYVFLILGALVSIFPFYWMFVVATNGKDAAFQIPPLLTPGTAFFDNFARVLERTEFFRALLNSVVVSTAVTLSVVFLCTLAGYAFAKYEFPLKKRCSCSSSRPCLCLPSSASCRNMSSWPSCSGSTAIKR